MRFSSISAYLSFDGEFQMNLIYKGVSEDFLNSLGEERFD